MKYKLLSIALFAFVFSCTQPAENIEFGENEEAAYREYLSTLASDEFMGRKPFTEGEEITLKYLEEQFKALGLEPGNGDSYFQDVPMVEIMGSLSGGKLSIQGANGNLSLDALTEVVGGTRRVVETQKLNQHPMVFAGFGINAPEYDWNDYEGLDVEGKIVVVMVNDPGFYNADLFRGRDMTYYGRWTYKFEEAARQGAAGVLIIHDTKPAAYDWSVVRSSWSKSKLFLQTENDNMDFCALEGWISGEAAENLFKIADVGDYTDLIEGAKKSGFKGIDLGMNLSGQINNTLKKTNSQNVVALLPGTTRKDEYIIYSGHWDHFGIGEKIEGDSIYNGAADNASGTAAIMTLAKKFKEQGPFERSMVFFSPTAEEAGLLGSEYYVNHPIYPLKNTVANINFDVLQPFGIMKDIYIVGKGQSNVDDYLINAAKRFGRTVKAPEDPSDGWFYRSDHFNFAKVGVPTLYVANGIESVEHGAEWGQAQKDEYTRLRYHKPQDNYSPDWDVSGSMEDLKLVYIVGKQLADSDVFPTWNEGTLYKRIREGQ